MQGSRTSAAKQSHPIPRTQRAPLGRTRTAIRRDKFTGSALKCLLLCLSRVAIAAARLTDPADVGERLHPLAVLVIAWSRRPRGSPKPPRPDAARAPAYPLGPAKLAEVV